MKKMAVVIAVAIMLTGLASAQVQTTCHSTGGGDVECTSTDITPSPDSYYRQGPFGSIYCGYKNCAADYRQGAFGPVYDPQSAAQKARGACLKLAVDNPSITCK